ncbi:MAG: hydantoinase/oxoprolinase family protein [Hyphomicrobiales bacterium]|nr:hydantoinase/oxoprolinase family protein [Hyphomicrobiales bacterium]
MGFFVGTDVGGTFTDLWVADETGTTRVFKTPTTKDVQSGVLDAVALAAEGFGLTIEQFCSRVERFGHGTTVGLNALLTGSGARTAILTTRGFGDTLEIGRLTRQSTGLNEHEYTDSFLRNRHSPLVPRSRIMEVDERIDVNGHVVVPLDEGQAREAIRAMSGDDIQAVAVCTLFSTVNPVHELRLRELVAEEMPATYVSLSHEVSPSVGEYARMSTTAANATLGPIAGGYLTRLEARLRAAGLRVPVLMMTCAGGVLPTTALNDRPVFALFSGPAGCVKGAQAIGDASSLGNILSTDIGGTSFDVGVIVDGAPIMRSELSIAGADLRVHSIDVDSIGAGGGSIAWIDTGGELRVGPKSAGADPGPACYGRGGTEPTATDADLVLGVLDPHNFIGGRLKLDVAAARRAIETRIAAPLGMAVEKAAWGIRTILDSRMADLLRRMTVERGYDPKTFTLLANGGAGPSHAWALAVDLGLDGFVVPAAATALSALGTAVSDFQFNTERAAYVRVQGSRSITAPEAMLIDRSLRTAAAEVAAHLESAARSDIRIACFAAIRYLGQTHHLDILLADASFDETDFQTLIGAFQRQYASLFGVTATYAKAGYEILSVRAVGTGKLTPPALVSRGEVPKPGKPRHVYFEDATKAHACAVWHANVPQDGWSTSGPAVIEFAGQSVVVPPGARAVADRFGNLHVRLAT